VNFETEALVQQILQPGLELVARELNTIFGPGIDVVEIAFEPGGLVGDLGVVNTISQLDEERESDVIRLKSANARAAPTAIVRVGIGRRRPHGRYFEGRGWNLSRRHNSQEQAAKQEKAEDLQKLWRRPHGTARISRLSVIARTPH
jgi:hypothetical protein